MSSNMQTEMLEELKKIREILEPKPAPPSPQPKGMINEFKDFFATYKVIGMAVAFIMGVYLGSLVSALVEDLVMPIIEFIKPGVDWKLIVAGPFKIGHFIGALITFVLVALVIFVLVKITTKIGIK